MHGEMGLFANLQRLFCWRRRSKVVHFLPKSVLQGKKRTDQFAISFTPASGSGSGSGNKRQPDGNLSWDDTRTINS